MGVLRSMVERFRRVKLAHVLPDVALMVLSGYASFWVIAGHDGFYERLELIHLWIAASIVVRLVVMILMGVYDRLWRYVSANDAVNLASALALSSFILFTTLTSFFGMGRNLPMAMLLNLFQLTVLLCGVRVLRRMFHEKSLPIPFTHHSPGKRTIILGAGDLGRTLAHRFMSDASLHTHVVGFVDDDADKLGSLICNIRVLGDRTCLPKVFEQFLVEELIIAIKDLPGSILSDVLAMARTAKVRPKLVSDLAYGGAGEKFEMLRDVSLDDLLKRPKANIDLTDISRACQDRTILITGAGGSIGSEIARQVAQFGPARLLLLDHSEFNLYSIDHELRAVMGDSSLIVPLLVDLRDREALRRIMLEHRPQIVFHAAAYKHVHLVEYNPNSAILNNVQGMRNLLDFSKEVNVERFVLISTDKAVNPAGVMGATKRLCELMMAQAARETGRLYCAVRFGNVVGSSGSLIPLLKKQIRDGGPVTITNENMTRYFMLIREAVSLVLMASTTAGPGDICILKMGEPIRIVDIARNLITLLGKTEKEVPIVFIGTRPGEKLHEELYLSGEEIDTHHADILLLPKGGQESMTLVQRGDFLERAVHRLIEDAQAGLAEAKHDLMTMVRPAQIDRPTGNDSRSADEIFAGTALPATAN